MKKLRTATLALAASAALVCAAGPAAAAPIKLGAPLATAFHWHARTG